ncbi:MAG: hypothetical protein ACYC75_01285 [Minisyncoccota bacterium]
MSQEPDIQKNVLEKIRRGEISMRSRIYFILRATLIGVVAVLALVGSLFMLSFVFFSIHASNIRFLLEFGERGLLTFIALFPWISFFIFLFLLIALEFLVRQFTSAYRFSLLRIFLWILIVGIAGSTLIGFTPLHSFLLSEADKGQLPILGSWYEQIHDSHQDQGVYRGDITSITGAAFVISHNDADRDSDEGTWTIVPPAGFDLSTLSVGEKVYVAGRLQSGVVYAYGIRVVSEGG